METLKKLASNVWFWVAIVITTLVALLGNETARRKLAELQLFKSVLDGKVALSDQKLEGIKSDIESEETNQAQLKKQEPGDLKPNEVEDFYKKN